MTWRTAFLAGVLVVGVLVVVGQVRSSLRHQDPAYLWGRYHESRQTFLISYLARNDHNVLERLASDNRRWFDELKLKGLLLRLKVPHPQDPTYEEFRRVTSGLMFIRPGWSQVGGQWPPGIEYVNTLDRSTIPTHFINTDAP